MAIHTTTTMQRRAAHSTTSTTDTHLGTSSNGNYKKKRSRVPRGGGGSSSGSFTQYGTRNEALVQMILLGGLFFVLLSYTLYHSLNSDGDDGSSLLPWKREPRYVPATSMKDIGDKTRRYAKLRQEYDDNHPDDPVRTEVAVLNLRQGRTYTAIANPQYDIYHCPDDPPPDYPYAWNILQVLEHWPPDDYSTPRLDIHQGLCVFDFHRDYDKAMTYRNAELPFVIRGDPAVAQTVERWNDPDGYMSNLMGNVPHRTEYSENNHFMYWLPPARKFNKKQKQRKPKMRLRQGPNGHPHVHTVIKPDNWTQPTEQFRMKYADWLKHANVTDDSKLGPDQPHWYYRLIGCGEMGNGQCDTDSSEYLFDELPFFQPREDTLYMVEPDRQRGIHCRFGMKGVIAENHFDGARNFIVLLGGERRYILSHPDQCQKLALYPLGHPSARHSAIDWSDPDLESFPQFSEAKANEVVMQAGDVMYLPTNWFHYIISLSLNMQCNTRSGISDETMEYIHDCGF